MTLESADRTIGRITLDENMTGKRSAGNPHAAFDEAGAAEACLLCLMSPMSVDCHERFHAVDG